MINNIEKKMKLAFAVSAGSFLASIALAVVVCLFAYRLVSEQRKNIYVLDHNVPVLVRHSPSSPV